MANAANKAALQSEGGGDVYAPPDHLIDIAEENHAHPNHHEHALRVALDDAENVALLASFREFGWPKSKTIAICKDGKRFRVTDGRRRLTFVRVENKRRKKERDPRGPIRPRVVLDDDPLLTETLGNSMHKDDPPMVKARRFVQLRETMGAGKAAAALGLTLEAGNWLGIILACPSPDLHRAVNARQIAVDVAARAVKAGSDSVGKALAAAKGPDGKVDPKKAKAEVQKAHEPRQKAKSAEAHRTLAKRFGGGTPDWTGAEVGALVAWLGGDGGALDAHPRLRERVESTGRKKRGKGGAS